MPQHIDDNTRQVVPRWRPFIVAAKLGLLEASGASRHPLEPSPGELEQLQRDWQNQRSPFHAMNLVDAAIVLNKPDIATDAAQYLLSNPPRADYDLSIAHFILAGAPEEEQRFPRDLSLSDRHRRIAAARRSLHREPRNAILLVDLGRDYSVLGQSVQAERAILQALFLAPESRFVLRAASRFFLHAGKPDMAHRVLRRAARTTRDPWLLAAEIVAATAAGRSSDSLKLGRSMIESGGFAPRHTSELASAIGTIEHLQGDRRQVRRLFDHALIDPTENTVAQATWIARHMTDFDVQQSTLGVPRAFEAGAWRAALEGRFTDAILLSWNWLRDEPFATRSALFGSWVAVTALEDYDTAIAIVSAARVANPSDPRLVAQLIYCLASLDKVDAAERLLDIDLPQAIRQHQDTHTETVWKVIETADRGLLAYRRGHVELGRAMYLAAIELAKRTRVQSLRGVAQLNLIREVMRADPTAPFPREQMEEALQDIPETIRPVFEPFVTRLDPRTNPLLIARPTPPRK